MVTNVDPFQAQLINKMRRGSLLVPGQTLLIMEVEPAAYITLAANEAEKAAAISQVYVSNVGPLRALLRGRLRLGDRGGAAVRDRGDRGAPGAA